MKIKEFIVMPHTADTMGLIHKPGVGPNNRYGFKNHSNNKANEIEKEELALNIKKKYRPLFAGIIGNERTNKFFKKDKRLR